MDSSLLMPNDDKENTILSPTNKSLYAPNINNSNLIRSYKQQNMSFDTYNGILTSMSNIEILQTDVILNGTSINNESFDADKVKYDAYEKSIQKLSDENKSLRKRVQKLTELARSKEEQLIEAFDKACEDKRKNEEKSQLEHNSQLQSYYECFLQIEKENDSLKAKMEQLKSKLAEQQSKLDEFTNKQEKEIPETSTVSSVLSDSTKQTTVSTIDNANNDHQEIVIEEEKKENDEINRISMKHIDEELTNLNKSIKTFIEDNKKKSIVINNETVITNETIITNNDRINELELEKEALNNKLTNIEAALARWIFRACDYKSDLSKSNEKLSIVEMRCQELNENFEILKQKNENEFKKLNEQLNEKKSLNEKLSFQFEDASTALNEKMITIVELNKKIDALKLSISDLEEQLERKKSNISDSSTQTINDPFTKLLVHNKSSGLVAQTAAKLSQLIHNNDDFKSAGQLNLQAPIVADQPNQHDINLKRIESLNNELTQIKTKLDAITLERNSFKYKNDELKRELELNLEKISQKKQAKSSTNFENKLIQTTTTAFNLTTISTQTTDYTNHVNHDCQKNTKVEHLKKDLDQLLQKSSKDQMELNKKLEEKISEISKLEQLNKSEKQSNVALNKNINELKEKLDQASLELDNLKLFYDQQLNKVNYEKKVSDTIIVQQKKLLDYAYSKYGSIIDSNTNETGSHNIKSKFNKKFKLSKNNGNNSNPMLANLHKTTNQQLLLKQQKLEKQSKEIINSNIGQKNTNEQKLSEIEAELNSNYETYSQIFNKNQNQVPIQNGTTEMTEDGKIKFQLNELDLKNNSKANSVQNQVKKQIHVFITGLNTCPTFCHVCQQLIPLIAYASKCQLCSFTCHSTCSSNTTSLTKAKSFRQTSQLYDPLKYCHINYLTNGIDYNNYINKLINFNYKSNQLQSNVKNILLSDYLYINVDNKWKKLWLTLRIDQPQLELYQSKTNQKPFDSINLLTDRVMVETNIKQIKKILSTDSNGSNQQQSIININQDNDPHNGENIYEELNENSLNSSLINFEQSSLIILLHNSKLSLQIGFTSFNKKNIWYDALQSSILLAQSLSLTKRSQTSLQNNKNTDERSLSQFKFFDIKKVLNPFLELCDTIVNSYCFINENVIALACDDGLYALNSFVGQNKEGLSNISLVKIDQVESAHKLYYQSEFGKLCFIGRKSRQFLSIDIEELNENLINGDLNSNQDNSYDDDEAKSVQVKLESINKIDRCHLFECSMNHNGNWYLAVATPETIFILLFNKQINKYSLINTIQTPNESACLCIKFTNNEMTNQLIYGCGKEFYKIELNCSFQFTPVIEQQTRRAISEDLATHQLNQQQHPIAICVINNSLNEKQEALLLCYEEYGIFLVYNFETMQWQQPLNSNIQSSSNNVNNHKKSSVSSIAPVLNQNNYLRWPRGNNLTPLQIEFDSSYLYLLYNDCIIVYNVTFENELLSVKKFGITFVYKPRYLSTFHTTNANCLVISNRRPLELSNSSDNSSCEQTKSLNNDNITDYEEFDPKSSSSRLNNPVIQDLNNKICLSYFSPDAN